VPEVRVIWPPYGSLACKAHQEGFPHHKVHGDLFSAVVRLSFALSSPRSSDRFFLHCFFLFFEKRVFSGHGVPGTVQ